MGFIPFDTVLTSLTDRYGNVLKRLDEKKIVDYCFDNQEIRELIEEYLKKITAQSTAETKNNEVSVQRRQEGNEKFKRCKYDECLSLYTSSIRYGEPGSQCLALAYSNRAVVLEKMGHHTESIQDVDMALSSGYPESKRKELYLRKARCLIRLGCTESAESVLQDNTPETNVREFIARELKLAKDGSVVTNSGQKSNFELPEPAGGANGNFMGASNHLSVFYSDTSGRHVLATHDIAVGDVLFVEKPFAYVLFSDVCHGCCRQVRAPIPCDKCLKVSYCSEDCKTKFWKSVHSFECGFGELFKTIGIAHLSLRIVLSASSTFQELKENLNKIKDVTHTEGTVVPYDSNSYDSVYNLVANADKYDKTDLFQYALTAVLLTLFLKKHTTYLSHCKGGDLKLLASVLWRHIMQLVCNGHAITGIFSQPSRDGRVVERSEGRIGTAIYPSASMMNHSCEPSIINSFHGNVLVVRASKSIRKGEEVFNCYGPHARRMARAERQEILQKQYCFKCECEACREKFDIQVTDEKMTSLLHPEIDRKTGWDGKRGTENHISVYKKSLAPDKFTALKCTDCKGALVPSAENSETRVCLNCGRHLVVSNELSEKIDSVYSLFQEGEDLVERDVGLALKKFIQSWQMARGIFYKFHKDLSYAADQAARCLAQMKEHRKCVLFLRCCILSVEERFGSLSVELGNELKKMADVIADWCGGKDNGKEAAAVPAAVTAAEEGIRCYEKCRDIFLLLFGGLRTEDLAEIEENCQMLKSYAARSGKREE